MRSDLDALMLSKNLDAILVIGNASHNPPMYYLTGGGHINAATLIKRRGEGAVLFCNDMEREEAARSGLQVLPYSTYNFQEILKEADGDPAFASAIRLKRMLIDQRVRGRVGLYGHTELGSAFALLTHLKRLMPELELVGETRESSLFMYAMETKDAGEVERNS